MQAKLKLISRNKQLEDAKSSLEEQLEEEEESKRTLEKQFQQANYAVKERLF